LIQSHRLILLRWKDVRVLESRHSAQGFGERYLMHEARFSLRAALTPQVKSSMTSYLK
jgi:hypothetical protein